jgi:hypothetical protein
MSKVEEIMMMVDYWGAHYGENPAFLNGIRKAIEAIAQPAGEAEPLTDEQIKIVAAMTATAEPGLNGYILPFSFARAIEAAHGIKKGGTE